MPLLVSSEPGMPFKRQSLGGEYEELLFAPSSFVGYIRIFGFTHLPMYVCVSVRPCMYLCMLVNTSASAAAHVYVYVCFKKRHDFCLSVCLSFCLSTCLSVCLSVDMHAQGASDMGFCMPAIRHACLDRWMDGRMFVCVHVCRLFCWFI